MNFGLFHLKLFKVYDKKGESLPEINKPKVGYRILGALQKSMFTLKIPEPLFVTQNHD